MGLVRGLGVAMSIEDSVAPAEEAPGAGVLEYLVVAILAIAALLAKDSAIDRWLNRRLGAASPSGLGIDDVGRGLAELAPEAAQGSSNEAGAVVDEARIEEVREDQLQFLRDVRDDVDRQIAGQERKLERFERYDLLVIRSRLMAGAFTLLLAVCCVVLVVVGYLPLGLVSGALAVIPGSGTIGLTRVTQLLEERMRTERASLEKDRETVRSVKAMLTIGDPALLDAEFAMLSRKFAAGSVPVDADHSE